MPQERLRSVVYRSFVTCEDPRGVIEGKTIRISKTDPTKMGSRRTENDSQLKNSKDKEKEKQKEREKEKEKMSSCKTPSSYQLVEVKNGAQKLNDAIDSWSKGVSFKGQPKDIAKDLLKGALDLQESLMMLGKLQEASCMAKLKKKPEKITSDRFENFRIYDTGFEKEVNLANGSSKDCFTELRDVIRDGLSKQNLLPNKSYQESVFARGDEQTGKGKLQLSPDMASTSSSRSSSMVYSTHEFTSSESFSSRATEEKSKGSNLIAKLMGLDEFPSKPLPSDSKNQLDRSKMKPRFDVDLPNAKKPHLFVQKMDREHMTLDQIIDMMQSKGFLRSNKREIKQNSKRFEDEAPPIVLMKPQKDKANPIRKLHQEKAKAENKAIKSREKSPSKKPKASVPGVVKPERKQEVEKKIDKIQKMAPQIKRKPIENAKSTNSVPKNASVKPPKNALPTPVTKRISSTGKSSNQKKNAKVQKAVNESLPTIVHEVLHIDTPNELETEESEAFKEESRGINQSESRNNQEETGVSDANEPKSRILEYISSFQDSDPTNSGLFQDCVNEFLDHENRRKSPWLTTSIFTSRIYSSDEQLMREIVKGVEDLRNYSNFSKDGSNADTVCGLLERDLCLSTMGGIWGDGWKDGCTLDEVEKVVLDLEKIVLSKLIDDMLMELVPYRTRYARVDPGKFLL